MEKIKQIESSKLQILYYDAQEAAMYLKENILENYMF